MLGVLRDTCTNNVIDIIAIIVRTFLNVKLLI